MTKEQTIDLMKCAKGKMESDIVQSVIQSNFIRSYDIKSKRTEQYSLMPSDIKLMAANLSEKLSITKP